MEGQKKYKSSHHQIEYHTDGKIKTARYSDTETRCLVDSHPNQCYRRPEGAVGLPGGQWGHDGLVPEDDDEDGDHDDQEYDDH